MRRRGLRGGAVHRAMRRATKPSPSPFPCEGRGDPMLARLDNSLRRSRTQLAIVKNFRAQTAPALQKFFRARREGPVHPIAWPAFLHAVKTDPFHLKILVDQ